MTVWAVLQSPVVKVKLAGETVASPVSLDETSIVTLAVGNRSSTTVNVLVVPVSETLLGWVTVKLAVSISVTVALKF